MSGFSPKPKHVAGSLGDSISAPAILVDSLPSAAVLLYHPAAHHQRGPAAAWGSVLTGGTSELLASRV